MNAHAQLVARPNIEQIVGLRNRALAAYAEAYAMRQKSNALAMEAHALHRAASSGISYEGVYARDSGVEFGAHHEIFGVPDEARFMSQTRWKIDADIWEYLLQATRLNELMDKAAKEDVRKGMLGIPTGDEIPKDWEERERWKRNGGDLAKGPVEVTAENLAATLEGFIAQADIIWRRGIANVFSCLDRRFRSHDGWKIGSRIILDHAFDDYGNWNYHRDHQDSFQDIERVFLILDGKEPRAQYAGIVGQITANRRMAGQAREFPFVVTGDYFRVRVFKNGNAHIWFERDDLLTKVNKLLGEYYGEVIPQGEREQTDEEIIKGAQKTDIARNYGFFPTPSKAAALAMEKLAVRRSDDMPPLRVLEPSAGTGNLAHLAAMAGANVDCVELQHSLAEALRGNPLYGVVYNADFLRLTPEITGKYDRVLMNPPFDRERDIDHVMHAMQFLKDGGQIVAIMSAGTEFRETKKSTAFRAIMQKLNATWQDLPAGSFSESGTNVNTLLLTVWKDGRVQSRW